MTPPTITHNAWLGETLHLTPGTYSGGSTIADEWIMCSDSAGASCNPPTTDMSDTYLIGNGDVGSYIKVTETVTGTVTPFDSNVTFQVAAQAPTTQSAPTISDTSSGSATIAQGDTLSVADGTWTEPPDYVTDQWLQCDGSGSNCTPISQATGTTYATKQSDVGHTIEVQETPHYMPNDDNNVAAGATATSAPSGRVQTTSAVSLMVSPSSLVTNQATTLVATVSSATAGTVPAGSVEFVNQGKPISGCGAVPVQPSGQSATVVCQTSFGAGSAQLTATFTPTTGSVVLGSSSSGQTLTVGRDTPTTSLDASAQVQVDATTTYTATVAPAAARSGPIQPSGDVEFLDGGQPIQGCGFQRLVSGGATCAIRYSATGIRSITARYLGDSNFVGSSSAAEAAHIIALPTKGMVAATMQWTFAFAPTYTRVLNMVINGVPTGASAQITCHGRGCPFAKRSTTIGKPKPCTGKAKRTHSCPVHGRISLKTAFQRRNLRPGAQITIEIRRPRFVGKYYRFTMVSRKQPRVQIGCLAVDSNRPNVGC
jgi:Bacterial Ig-like domain (group 3)